MIGSVSVVQSCCSKCLFVDCDMRERNWQTHRSLAEWPHGDTCLCWQKDMVMCGSAYGCEPSCVAAVTCSLTDPTQGRQQYRGKGVTELL
jgi:hypothetical protein